MCRFQWMARETVKRKLLWLLNNLRAKDAVPFVREIMEPQYSPCMELQTRLEALSEQHTRGLGVEDI